MNAAMAEKIRMIDDYIQKLDNAIKAKDSNLAKQIQHEVIAVYENEILEIRKGLNAYSVSNFYSKCSPNYISDAEVLKAKLNNYKLNLAAWLVKPFNDGSGSVQVTQTVQQDVKNTIAITLEQIITNVNSLPSSILSDEDKEILCGKLATLSAEKSKESKWEKAKGILKWMADKSVDVGIATLPFIIQALNNAQM